MMSGIEIEVWQVSGPWFDVVKEGMEESHVMRVVPPHFCPSFAVSTHTREPQVFAGVWQLPPQPEKGTGCIKLVAIELEMFPKDLEGVDLLEWRSRWKIIVYKPGIGFFEIELITIVGDGDLAGAKQLVKFFHQETVALERCLIPLIVGEGSYGHFLFASPLVREAEHIPVFEDFNNVLLPDPPGVTQ